MRGDVALHARLVLRPEGALGLTAAVAGTTAVASSYLPWYQVNASMELLGTTSDRSVSQLSGWQAHPWSWLLIAISVAMVAVGLLLAIDRPAPNTPDALLLGGIGLAIGAAIGGRWFPPVERFDVAGSRLRDMLDLAGRLPEDVSLDFTVAPGVGLWLSLAAAALLVACGLTARAIR